jgi:hypothetical protein
MSEPLADQVLQKISESGELYYRLILLVDPADSGKTKTLQEVSALTSAPLINVNLELSRRMLDLAERRRAPQISKLLGEIVGETKRFAKKRQASNKQKSVGSIFLEIGKRGIATIEVALPLLAEQRAIVSVLSDMDAEIKALERRREKTRQVKQGMMQQLLTGRLRLVNPEY